MPKSRTFMMLAAFLALASAAEIRAQSESAPVDPDHAVKMANGLRIFKEHVRPLLVAKCLNCHGGTTTEGELDITDRDRLLKGGNGGPAFISGDAKKSLLYRMINHEKKPFMPFEASKLPDAMIQHIAAWIDSGAPYDAPLIQRDDALAWTRKVVSPEARDHWAYRPLECLEPQALSKDAWNRNNIDRFILAKLREKKLTPNEPALPRQLIRRAYFDLIGLPPKPDDVDQFLKDYAVDSTSAWDKLIEKLLASPHYGERWARHWLDLARFAESHGFEHDTDRPTAYHYRDFVIRAFNNDLPYNTFVKWQLAGDEIAPSNPEALLATGFLAAGVHSTQITKNEVEKHRYDELDDMLSTTGTAMLGLTVGCARCHDHKFDAIPSRDYYRMLATFTTTVRTEADIPHEKEVEIPWANTFRALISSEGVKAVRLHTQGEDFMPQTFFLKRGDPAQKDGPADAGFLQVLRFRNDESKWSKTAPKDSKLSYRRSAFADWITDVDEGAGRLLARVIVNRLWQHHFGRGIVATPSDFGIRGEKPTHPELLDRLATELIRNGWRLKHIHRIIMTSAAYQQSARIDGAKRQIDKENLFLWRQPVRRLEAEIIRDSILSVGGKLDAEMFGKGTLDPNSGRRSIYFTMKRAKLIPALVIFDAPDGTTGIGDRPSTTIAPQALHLMNNGQVRVAAHGLARRVAASDPRESIPKAYRIALAREPTTDEVTEGIAFVGAQAKTYQGKPDAAHLALTDFCQVLMCLNEFVYVE